MSAASRQVRAWASLLVILNASVVFAGFIAPYAPNEQNRNLPFAGPTRLHFIETTGQFHLRPFVYLVVSTPGSVDKYEEDRSRRYPVRFLIRGARYTIAGFAADRHLFGVEEPAKVFLFGTDQFGRDVFSRLLVGAQISLVAGVLAAGLALSLGVALGALAGFYGGWTDDAGIGLAVLVPRYILAEVTLSFFGLGVAEPVPSWGNMLAAVQRYDVLTSYWWMFLPGIALSPVFLLYYALANALHEHTALLSS